MGKTQVSEKDRPDREQLEQIVKDAGASGIGTTELSEKSGIRLPYSSIGHAQPSHG